MRPIWVVDDDRSIRWVLEKALTRAQMPFRLFSDAQQVLQALADERPSVLLSDIRMHGMNGMELLEQVKKKVPELPVIIMTAFTDLDSAVNAFQGGAYEYLPKPFDINAAIELLRRASMESETAEQTAAVAQNQEPAREIIGQSQAMQEVYRAIGRLSQSNITVLLTGESGCGKEVVARALHRHSPRANAPFVAINTAAIPRELLESELFGHEKGSFTGAVAMQQGRFEQAKGGTLFLDEIGDMPMELQTRLLRVLSDGYFYRVGGRQSIKADVRIIAATNQDLEERVAQSQFREDLYHRLNVIHLRLPPLRERSEDIAALAQHFLRLAAQELHEEPKRLSEEALKFMQAFEFPGNVRQLENICKWLTVMAPSQVVQIADLPEEIRNHLRQTVKSSQRKGQTQTHWTEGLAEEVRDKMHSDEPGMMQQLQQRFESTVYKTALECTHGRRIEAAQKLGVGRNTLTRKVQELGIESAPSGSRQEEKP